MSFHLEATTRTTSDAFLDEGTVTLKKKRI